MRKKGVKMKLTIDVTGEEVLILSTGGGGRDCGNTLAAVDFRIRREAGRLLKVVRCEKWVSEAHEDFLTVVVMMVDNVVALERCGCRALADRQRESLKLFLQSVLCPNVDDVWEILLEGSVLCRS
jgi:hypothetical protein